jgi:acetyl esterase
MALMFARAGYVVFTINYRLAPAHPFPAAAEDAAAAYLWVLEHAHAYGADPNRVALSGESAGANLTLGLALSACERRPEPFAQRVFQAGVTPRAILPNCGLFQVTEPERFAAEKRLPVIVRDRIKQVCGEYLGAYGLRPRPETELADPVRVVETAPAPGRPFPPTYLSVGTADPIASDTPRLARALERWSAACELDVYPGETHAFHALLWRNAARACWDAQLAFLARYLPPGRRRGDAATRAA